MVLPAFAAATFAALCSSSVKLIVRVLRFVSKVTSDISLDWLAANGHPFLHEKWEWKLFVDTCPPAGYLKKMEYFFDIATPEEIARQFPTSAKIPSFLEHDRQLLKENPDDNLTELVYLYWGRGEKKKAEQLRQQIKNEEQKLSVGLSLYEFRES